MITTGAITCSIGILGIFACAAIRMNNRNDTSIGPIATSIALMAAGWGMMG